ncbi:MAG: hypothetical protein WCA64_05730 [Gallionella sp.]
MQIEEPAICEERKAKAGSQSSNDDLYDKGTNMKAAKANETNAEFQVNSPVIQYVPHEQIETRGMLQPILLRPPPGGNFLMITGERKNC